MLHNYNPEMSSRPLSTHSPHSSVSIFIAPSKNSLFQIKCLNHQIKFWQCPPMTFDSPSLVVTVNSLSMNIGQTMPSLIWTACLNELKPLADWVFHNNPTETHRIKVIPVCAQQTWSTKIQIPIFTGPAWWRKFVVFYPSTTKIRGPCAD